MTWSLSIVNVKIIQWLWEYCVILIKVFFLEGPWFFSKVLHYRHYLYFNSLWNIHRIWIEAFTLHSPLAFNRFLLIHTILILSLSIYKNNMHQLIQDGCDLLKFDFLCQDPLNAYHNDCYHLLFKRSEASASISVDWHFRLLIPLLLYRD